MGDHGTERGEFAEAARRRVVYCLIPADLAERLHQPLRAHFRDDPQVEVVVESRRADRRAVEDRRASGTGKPPKAGERRRIRSRSGRRVEERRVEQVVLDSADAPELPRRARRFAPRFAFVERLEPTTEAAEDADTARLVLRIQGGDREAFGLLYRRYFDRVYGYMRVALRDAHDAEELTQTAFANAFEALPGYERTDKPFRSWLFTIVRNVAVSALRTHGRVEPVDPVDLAERQEANGEPEELPALNWVSDRDLLILIERLPAVQRQVITLRFMFGLQIREIAELIETTPNHASVLQYRALGFLRKRLSAAGREPQAAPRARTQRCVRQARVLRRRRFALSP